MRRKDLEVKGKENIESIIVRCKSLRLGMIESGKPYVLPFVFGYNWDDSGLKLYLHSSIVGRKRSALGEGALVAFEMDLDEGLMGQGLNANTYTRAFSAVMGEGTISYAEAPEEKISFFNHIMKHQTGREGFSFNSAYLAVTRVFVINVDMDTLSASRKELDMSHHLPEYFPEGVAPVPTAPSVPLPVRPVEMPACEPDDKLLGPSPEAIY